MSTQLTKRQGEILDFLELNAIDSGRAPTLNELCAMLGLRSRGSLHKHIQALIAAGRVAPMNGRHTGIRLLPKDEERTDGLPFLGRIAAGRQIEAMPQSETIQVPAHLYSERPCYVLQVTGDSMCDAGILDGDYVIVEHRAAARNGEIVVALIRGEDTTLKRIRQEPGRVTLIPQNGAMPPMEFLPQEVEIQGVVVGLMRAYG